MKSLIYTFMTISIIAFILVFSWFKDGYILGTAEAVIPFYNVERYFHQVSEAWADNNPGLGIPNGIITAYAPTYFILSILQSLGIPGFIIEASFFWFLLTSVGIGVHFLVRELFPKIHWRFILIAILFYWFNSISLVNVWNRFLFNYMVFWAMLPIITALFIKGLNSRNYLFVFLIGIVSLIFSLALSALVFNILLWLLFFYITLFWLITQKDFSKKRFYTKFFILTLAYFCLVNFWWISQVINYLHSGKYTTDLSLFFQHSVDLTTLTSLSKILGKLTNLFVFKHEAFFSTPTVEWAKLYDTNDIVFIEFLISGIILFYIMRNRKNISTLFLGTLFFLGIFLAKGNNPPLGGIFQFIFERINILHSFRNAFEKFGFIIILAAAPLLAASLEDLSVRFKRYGKYIYIFCFLTILTLFGYPFFSGLVFTSASPPTNDYSVGYRVKVPAYYEEADQWLSSKGKNFRFIGFPLRDQGVTYKWEKGYQGIEPSSLLFSTPNILFNTTVPYYERIVLELEKLLLNTKDFSKVANVLNARYIMVRSDVDFQERGMRDPGSIAAKLIEREQAGEFKKVVEFGKLTFWENVAWEDRKIYPVSTLIQVFPQAQISDFTLDEYKDIQGLYDGSLDPSFIQQIELQVLHPAEDKSISDLKSKTYTFNINNVGVYETVLDTFYLKNYDRDDFTAPEITLDKNIVLKKGVLREDGRLSYGEINLSQGKHEINVSTPKTGNLINLSAQPEIRIRSLEDPPIFEFVDFNPYMRYFISFDYLIRSGSTFQLVINQDNDQIKNGKVIASFSRPISQNIHSNNFGKYQDYFEPRDSANRAELSFALGTNDGEVIVKNIEVRGLLEPKPILIKENFTANSIKDFSEDIPRVSYIKHDLTKYLIEVKDAKKPFILVFSELFDNGWKAKFDDETFANKHFLVNSFANGWIIERTGDFGLTLEFIPQRLLNIGKIISTLTFLGGVILVIFIIFFKKVRGT